MSENIEQVSSIKDEIHITYYFTILFTIIGTVLIMFLLSNKVERISFFIIFLSLTAGGLPIGMLGAFLDYKISEFKQKYRKAL